MFPEPLPEGAAYRKLIERVTTNEIIRGNLLSKDGSLTLIVLALDPKVASGASTRDVMDEINDDANRDLANSGLKVELSGVPVMQQEIRNAVERDERTYNAIGFLAGCTIPILFFRHVSFMIMAAGPPLTAILLALGALGWLDFRLNMFLNVMTPLIMVISFSDSMQLTFAARDRLLAGQPKYDAVRDALLVVGPACVLTHVTAGCSFVALQFSNSDLIVAFGRAGLIAIIIALGAIFAAHAAAGRLVFARRYRASSPKFSQRDFGVACCTGLRLHRPAGGQPPRLV